MTISGSGKHTQERRKLELLIEKGSVIEHFIYGGMGSSGLSGFGSCEAGSGSVVFTGSRSKLTLRHLLHPVDAVMSITLKVEMSPPPLRS